jgi:hypothetical protein
MAITTKTIFNQALAMLGTPPVNFFDPEKDEVPESAAGKVLAEFYEWSVEEAQSMFPWQELIMQATISAEANKDAWGRNVFPYEADILNGSVVEGDSGDKPLRLLGARVVTQGYVPDPYHIIQPTDSNISYEMRGGKIYTYGGSSDSPPNLQTTYVAGVKDPAKWSPELSRVIIYTLASNGAFAVTQSGDLAMMLYQKLQEVIAPMAHFMQAETRTSDRLAPRQTGLVLPPAGLAVAGPQPAE